MLRRLAPFPHILPPGPPLSASPSIKTSAIFKAFSAPTEAATERSRNTNARDEKFSISSGWRAKSATSCKCLSFTRILGHMLIELMASRTVLLFSSESDFGPKNVTCPPAEVVPFRAQAQLSIPHVVVGLSMQ